jgi:hypothetical protein
MIAINARIPLLLAISLSFLTAGDSTAQTEPAGSVTEIGKLAAAMAPRTWAELKTTGLTWELVKVTSAAEYHIFMYSDDAAWDPATEQFLFLGIGHYTPWKFITYSATTNRWQEVPLPGWASGPAHGYDHNAIDPSADFFYHLKSNTRQVYEYNIANAVWRPLPENLEASYIGHGMALQYFPEMNGLIHVFAGSVYFFKRTTATWSTLRSNLPMGGQHNIAKYNSGHGVMLLGGGDTWNGPVSRDIHRLDANGIITTLRPAPTGVGITQSVITDDPVSGKFLVISGGKFYAFDIMSDTWELLSDPSPFGHDGTVAARVDNYGVTMFIHAEYFKNPRAYLYKHRNRISTGVSEDVINQSPGVKIEAWPNPANPATSIKVSLPPAISNQIEQGAPFVLHLYDIQGRLVESFDRGGTVAGSGLTMDLNTSRYQSGIYFIRFQAGSQTAVQKLTVIK